MKLVMVIVPQEYSHQIIDALIAAQNRATLVSTAGGILRRGDATLLVGVETHQVDDVFNHIEKCCAGRTQRTDDSCATIFVPNVEKYQKVWSSHGVTIATLI